MKRFKTLLRPTITVARPLLAVDAHLLDVVVVQEVPILSHTRVEVVLDLTVHERLNLLRRIINSSIRPIVFISILQKET